MIHTIATRTNAKPTSSTPHHLGQDCGSLTKAATTGNAHDMKNNTAVPTVTRRWMGMLMVPTLKCIIFQFHLMGHSVFRLPVPTRMEFPCFEVIGRRKGTAFWPTPVKSNGDVLFQFAFKLRLTTQGQPVIRRTRSVSAAKCSGS